MPDPVGTRRTTTHRNTSAGEARPKRETAAETSAPKKLDVFVPTPDDRDLFSEVRAKPADKKVVLDVLTHTEEVLREVSPKLLKDLAFMTQAVIANPFVLLNEGENDWQKEQNLKALPKAMRAKLLADPNVKAAVDSMKADLAKLADIDPGMFTLDRKFLRELMNNRLNPGAEDKRPLAVVIYPRDDWNGQFTGLQAELAGKHRVMFYRVSSDAEATHAIAEAAQKKPASFVVLGGHGSQRLMAFGAEDPGLMSQTMQARVAELMKTEKGRQQLDKEIIRTNESRYFDFTDADILKPLASKLAPGAELILFSCSTGEGKKSAKNLANFMHEMFPHVNIVAPTKPVPNNGLVFDKKGNYQRPSFEHSDQAYRIAAGKPSERPKRAHEIRT